MFIETLLCGLVRTSAPTLTETAPGVAFWPRVRKHALTAHSSVVLQVEREGLLTFVAFELD